MYILIVLHIFITLALIGIILLQKGESGGLAASGAKEIFSARGSSNFLTKITGILATLFIGNCILMTIIASYQSKQKDLVSKAVHQQKIEKSTVEQNTQPKTTAPLAKQTKKPSVDSK